ncbi:hypothetical protein IE81DRAFT_76691 [Ceraceosorus guamensis]|uniref:Uncharacterized protein n=1 Tax=Ceraceosorus guamensis TaxID=1522189 RepID=A0A316W645_9BASI|nr:hypothetical protein IE81DRAFT_76691 [Ceraceosorus guamensis]PWN43503.1 hypothetical protein IE81DRAFT_76691 [Ceraceosorus guamensis]
MSRRQAINSYIQDRETVSPPPAMTAAPYFEWVTADEHIAWVTASVERLVRPHLHQASLNEDDCSFDGHVPLSAEVETLSSVCDSVSAPTPPTAPVNKLIALSSSVDEDGATLLDEERVIAQPISAQDDELAALEEGAYWRSPLGNSDATPANGGLSWPTPLNVSESGSPEVYFNHSLRSTPMIRTRGNVLSAPAYPLPSVDVVNALSECRRRAATIDEDETPRALGVRWGAYSLAEEAEYIRVLHTRAQRRPECNQVYMDHKSDYTTTTCGARSRSTTFTSVESGSSLKGLGISGIDGPLRVPSEAPSTQRQVREAAMYLREFSMAHAEEARQRMADQATNARRTADIKEAGLAIQKFGAAHADKARARLLQAHEAKDETRTRLLSIDVVRKCIQRRRDAKKAQQAEKLRREKVADQINGLHALYRKQDAERREEIEIEREMRREARRAMQPRYA